jgi:hypothetical protein
MTEHFAAPAGPALLAIIFFTHYVLPLASIRLRPRVGRPTTTQRISAQRSAKQAAPPTASLAPGGMMMHALACWAATMASPNPSGLSLDVDWGQFLARSDMTSSWSRHSPSAGSWSHPPPLTYNLAGFLGNGNVGAMVQATSGGSIVLVLGRTDVYDRRVPGSPFATGKLLCDVVSQVLQIHARIATSGFHRPERRRHSGQAPHRQPHAAHCWACARRTQPRAAARRRGDRRAQHHARQHQHQAADLRRRHRSVRQ